MIRKKSKKKDTKTCNCTSKNVCKGGAIYGFGLVGAAVYYITTSTGFWNGVWGLIKAFFWPAFLVYKAFIFLGM